MVQIPSTADPKDEGANFVLNFLKTRVYQRISEI